MCGRAGMVAVVWWAPTLWLFQIQNPFLSFFIVIENVLEFTREEERIIKNDLIFLMSPLCARKDFV